MTERRSDVRSQARQLAGKDWTIEIHRTEDGGFFARVAELPGCMTEADSWNELMDMLEEAMIGWFEVSLDHGDPIPEPRGSGRYSGSIFVRTSPYLHRLVAEAAEREGVSMSQWVAERLAGEVGLRRTARPGGS